MKPKFRFWYEREDFHPDENYMRDVWKIEYITDSKIELNDNYIFNPYTNVAENIYANTKIYLMQSTGLKDKNGVEIYEGDYIDCKWGYDDWSGVAEFIEGSFCTNPLSDLKFPSIINECSSIKVIGNIYENPELLEVAE